MLAFRVRQKESSFYLVPYRAEDLVKRVRLTARAHPGEAPSSLAVSDDPVARFIESVERNDESFQRKPMRAKIAALLRFYESESPQPIIPGTILLYTKERLDFRAVPPHEDLGDLSDPRSPFLVIDGQHRLAALSLYLEKNAQRLGSPLHIPCLVFDGQQEEFAAEMFVVINSTATRINKSHLIDLYDKLSRQDPTSRVAAHIVRRLYDDDQSPLHYRINLLGGRSQRDKWIFQAELYPEIYTWVLRYLGEGDDPRRIESEVYNTIRDGLVVARKVFAKAWGDNEHYRVTTSVTLRAILRALLLLARRDTEPVSDRVERWTERLSPWVRLVEDFRAAGFYERFAAKGYVERIRRIEERLCREAGIELRGS